VSGFRLRVTYVGGPTGLLELGGLRLLTDPTFDPVGSEYPTPVYVLRKTQGPALDPATLGPIDIVLLSHDHHFDNLDHAGRRALATAGLVLTTLAGADRLGGNAIGLTPWLMCRQRTAAGCASRPPLLDTVPPTVTGGR
jgi:L-ascorbate metabolism protein UlaG (beta-lactamase superfamily)